MKRSFPRLALPVAASLLLGACSAFAPPVAMPPLQAPALDAPPAWQASPGGTQGMADLRLWWQQFDDPVLPGLIDEAQAASPNVAAAASRIEQARAARVAAGAALVPGVGLNGRASYGRANVGAGFANVGSAALDLGASWELDFFGANQAGRDAAQSRLEGAQAGWYDARISVAAEVGSTYNALRGCQAQVVQTEADVRSREETARLSELAANAGLLAPANAALSRASAAQGRNLLESQRAQCDVLIKGLVALTALDEPTLRSRLAPGTARQSEPATIAVNSVPGSALAQRPDLLDAEKRVVAAAEDTLQSQARRYPRVSIAGSLGPTYLRLENSAINGNLWTIGPLQLSLPLFDGGTLEANVLASRARYDEALSAYRALVRGAVREVETALLTLDSTARRTQDAKVAAEGFEASLRAADARYRGGLGSLFDLEEARRSALVANITLVQLQQDRVAAWISLYRALGGGWTRADPDPNAALAAAPTPQKTSP